MAKACVMVYGDVGRSPRMQNHAIELSNSHEVYLMGYLESPLRSEIANNPHIHLVELQLMNYRYLKAFSYYLYILTRIVLEIVHGLYLLVFKHRDTQIVLVQNPPCIPVLFTVYIASFLAPFRLIIDFHNYAYTILALSNRSSFLVKIAKIYEMWLGRKANGALCVSNAMKEHLKKEWNINAITVYDRPLTSVVLEYDQQKLFKKYGLDEIKDQELLLVSSTSWTKDEDFSILLDALEEYEKSDSNMVIRTLITGKGPEKEMYLKQIAEKEPDWKKISVRTLWLDADDYPLLLRSCNLGVCLHFSSSGLDLPMKVVDMFAAGLPVLAKSYPALNELVKDKVNGYVFDNKSQLSSLLQSISKNPDILIKLKKEAIKETRRIWSEEWNACAEVFKNH